MVVREEKRRWIWSRRLFSVYTLYLRKKAMRKEVFFVLPVVGIMLVASIWSGWLRLGWPLPLLQPAAHHGGLMTVSFLSTLILLERTVTFPQRWFLVFPLLNGISGFFLILGMPDAAFPLLLTGSAALAVMSAYTIYRYKEDYFVLYFLGALLLIVGNALLWKTGLYRVAVPWWMGFLLFTITAERLELTKFLAVSRVQKTLLWLGIAISLAGILLPFHAQGRLVLGVGLAAAAFWLLRFDMAFRSVKVPGQHKYNGIGLILGYCWLLVSGLFLVFDPGLAFGYDAMVHSFFLGFVFSMIFAHAPIIFPAVLNLSIRPYHPVLYVWVGLLQLTLSIRVAADVLEWVLARKYSGLANGLVILGFFLTLAVLFSLRAAEKRKLKTG